MVLKYDIFKFSWAVDTEKRIFKCLRPNSKRKIGFSQAAVVFEN